MSATKPGILKDKEHLFAMAGLFLSGLVAFLVVRWLLVPADFGRYGHFRPGALDDNRQHALVYAGREACEGCHSDVADVKKGGRHAGVGCEACHGPLARHAEDPGESKALRPDGRVLCLRCHTANAAKPHPFPQIDPQDHAGEGACTECHAAHHPDGEQGTKP